MRYCGLKDDENRCRQLGAYIIENGATVRRTAKHFGVSKSTVHKDVTMKLKKKDKTMYGEVMKVIEKNKSERHIRGGLATKQKYAMMKQS